MYADDKSAQPVIPRRWAEALVRRAMKGYEVEAAMQQSVVDRLLRKTTLRDPGVILRSRRYIRNSSMLMDPANWEQFVEDVFMMVSTARAERNHELSRSKSAMTIKPHLGRKSGVDEIDLELELRRRAATAKVGDSVHGYVRTQFGWM